MDESRKRELVENSKGCTIEGSPAWVGGWRNSEASLAPDFGGFWIVDWETVDRVLSAENHDFKASDVRFHSWRWLGIGDEIPEAIKDKLT